MPIRAPMSSMTKNIGMFSTALAWPRMMRTRCLTPPSPIETLYLPRSRPVSVAIHNRIAMLSAA